MAAIFIWSQMTEIKGWVSKREEDVVDVLCDRCGASTKISMGFGRRVNHETDQLEEPTESFTNEYGTISASWGYWSNGRDGDTEQAHLCEKCWDVARGKLEEIGVKFQVSNHWTD